MKFKLKIQLLSLAFILCLFSSAVVYAEGPSRIIINSAVAEIPEDMGSIKEFSGRTFVPVRFLLEYFNYLVSWDEEDRIVFGRNYAGDVFVMQVGSPFLTVREDGKKSENITMDVEPVLVAEEGRTYVPIRFLAQAIGYTVGYDDATGTVMLGK